jgi:hypothetical protein
MEKKDVNVGDIVDEMCGGITPFNRGEEDKGECQVGTLEEVEVWEKREREWMLGLQQY